MLFRSHGGECWNKGPAVCYGCGQPGHYKNACPNVATGANAVPRINAQGNANQGNRNQQQGRAYALVPGDPRNDEEIIAGRIYIHGIPTYALFDSGSTHSFISNEHATKIGRNFECLDFNLIVSQPMSKGVMCSMIL